MSEMTDRKPYLLRAIYQWIVDNDCTPHLVIAAPGAGWVHGVPSHLLQEDMLVLNISPQATAHLQIEDDNITFHTRFGGKSHQVWVAMAAVVSLVARENGEGISLPVADDIEAGPKNTQQTAGARSDAGKTPDNPKPPAGSSHLRIIK